MLDTHPIQIAGIIDAEEADMLRRCGRKSREPVRRCLAEATGASGAVA